MILEFTVENYRSFYGKKTLVLEADKALKECSETNLVCMANKHIFAPYLSVCMELIRVESLILSVLCTRWQDAFCCL